MTPPPAEDWASDRRGLSFPPPRTSVSGAEDSASARSAGLGDPSTAPQAPVPEAPAPLGPIRIIGFGMGPQHLTPEAAAALTASDYVIAARKSGDDALLAIQATTFMADDLPEPVGPSRAVMPVGWGSMTA